MQVDHKLIEKYHLNQCTPEERNLVEEWLIDDTLDFPSLPISQADKSHIQSEIWENISPHITESPVIIKENLIKKRFRYIAIAASLLIIFGFYISKII
ncbi:hypothetical protein OKW96_01035 [Sphingobacterium sp. KU25419]|nr:hypothetical protein OKW96_01035 [Sphingobacterium sp. KU25419]